MTDHDAFLRAILESPGDDTPRLIYADYLEERGDPRGEFIRVQCELAKPPTYRHFSGVACLDISGATLDRVTALRRRERELATPGRLHQWLGALPGLATWVGVWPDDVGWLAKRKGENAVAIRAAFRRGFPAHVALSTAAFREHAAALFGAAPIEGVRLSDKRPAGRNGKWEWRDGHGGDTPHRVPRELWQGMGLDERGERVHVKTYRTLKDANAALSWWAVWWGRWQAGLPSLAGAAVPSVPLPAR